jgi:type IV pilus assembly protein PilA
MSVPIFKIRYTYFFLNLSKRKNQGFTMTELLVVIIIIGILSAISLPAFINQSAKAKHSEAKTYIGAVNRAQQAYRTENHSFADNMGDLAIGIKNNTSNFEYEINLTGALAVIMATPVESATMKGFSGAVTSELTQTIICQTKKINSLTPLAPPSWNIATQKLSCDGDMELMQ